LSTERTGIIALMLSPRMIIFILLSAASVLFGYYAWQESRQATVIIEWSTASELNTVGFNLYRSTEPQGEYILINAELIPASEDAWTGAEYSFVDSGLTPGVTYYYMLEDLDATGQRSKNGPIEVKANGRGRLELGLAGFSLFIGLWGLVLSIKTHRRSIVG
jgi:hypothetical protein